VADEGDAVLAEHIRCLLFDALSVGATRSEGPAPQGKGCFVGGDLQGEPKKQNPAARRAQSFDPKPSPTDRAEKQETAIV
jgi:hypothetical protein